MELRLPPGNYLEPDPDLLVLRKRAKVDFVAAFNVQDATKESLEKPPGRTTSNEPRSSLSNQPHKKESDRRERSRH
jgi:hypothetical protein